MKINHEGEVNRARYMPQVIFLHLHLHTCTCTLAYLNICTTA